MNKKETYLIAVDMDGTVFHNLLEYDVKSTEILKKLKKEHKVIIATGRPFRSSDFYYDIIGLDTPIINYNGALIQNKNDENFKKVLITISKEHLIEFINKTRHHLKNIFCEIEDDIFCLYETEHIMPHLHLDGGKAYFGEMTEILNSDPHGALVFLNTDCREELVKYVDETFNGSLKIRFWYSQEEIVGELYNPNITKGNAIKHIADYYNIDQDHIITFGDGQNDVEMLQCAKYGVAMGNSSEYVKSCASYITSSIYENGVYEFLSKFFNIE